MSSKWIIEAELRRITDENERLRKENASLRRRLGCQDQPKTECSSDQEQNPPLTRASDVEGKIRCFRGLFHRCEDVYPIRSDNQNGRAGYSSVRGNEWHKVLCGKPKVGISFAPRCRPPRCLTLTVCATTVYIAVGLWLWLVGAVTVF